ncbi:hypothetical protein [Nocardia sp. NPDC057030]|uniref:hypothetical protein n=1 Tax=unclassified Nocardia TaxID=2637762 RepID=UPI00362FA11F
MSSEVDMSIPKDVRAWMQDLREVGLEPHAAREAELWVVSVTTERAEMRLELQRSDDGRWKWHDSTLTVDGELRPNAKDADDLARIIRLANGLEPDEILPMPPERDPSEAPPQVQQQYYNFARRTDVPVLVGYDGQVWVIGLDMERASLRLVYVRRARHRLETRIALYIDGENRSAEVAGDLTRAMAMMAAANQSPAAPKTIGAASGPANPNSPESRKGTVMRN